jgi:hypothetical protein
MPALPKSFVSLGASLLTVRMALQLRRQQDAVPAQERCFRQLTARLVGTEQGRTYGLERGLSYAEFSRRVPVRTYEQLVPQIERMKRGEADVLWPGRCRFYAVSSGTTAGRTKYLPITDEMLGAFPPGRPRLAALLHGPHRPRRGLPRPAPVSRRLHRARPAARHRGGFPAYGGDLSGLTALNLPGWPSATFTNPAPPLPRWRTGPPRSRPSSNAPTTATSPCWPAFPAGCLILAEAIRNRASHGKARPSHLQAVWPNLECLVHGGVPIGPFADELRLACGSNVKFHEVYPASEAFIAAQDAESVQGLRLIADAGVFYEFLPLRDFNEDRLTNSAPRSCRSPA